MSHRFDIIPVPTEAGTHFPGQCKASHAIMYDGRLIEKLRAQVSDNVVIHGEVDKDDFGILGKEIGNLAKWKPSEKVNGVRNLDNSLRIMQHLHQYLLSQADNLGASFPIALGGDCSITPAVLSAFYHFHQGKKVGLLYIDGDADLTLPSQTSAEGSSGILDSMNMSHLTRRDGSLKPMSEFSRPDGSALITPDNVVLFGFDPLQPATEHWVYLVENGFKCFTRPTVQRDLVGSVRTALQYLEERVDVILLHFDVDVIDSGLFPLANYPHYAGLKFKEAMQVIDMFLRCETVKGLIITEVNPNNDAAWVDPEASGEKPLTMIQRLVDWIMPSLVQRFG